MPFGPYRDFDDCVAQNQDKANPEAYCGEIQRRAEGALTELLDRVRARLATPPRPRSFRRASRQ